MPQGANNRTAEEIIDAFYKECEARMLAGCAESYEEEIGNNIKLIINNKEVSECGIQFSIKAVDVETGKELAKDECIYDGKASNIKTIITNTVDALNLK